MVSAQTQGLIQFKKETGIIVEVGGVMIMEVGVIATPLPILANKAEITQIGVSKVNKGEITQVGVSKVNKAETTQIGVSKVNKGVITQVGVSNKSEAPTDGVSKVSKVSKVETTLDGVSKVSKVNKEGQADGVMGIKVGDVISNLHQKII
jgi:hypothetical protein